ncbi:hypothetical protein M595_1691 [Lyngbya aestuarii BL J]|uniref:Uncharacterized protein n=1 Tax=Lyngbya aestuarii BL J TaxID=1348334 RepID=U7QJW9_9CYAN|nr:hypothetical protein M595_1691 [Lyngbya aestuarii BL J]
MVRFQRNIIEVNLFNRVIAKLTNCILPKFGSDQAKEETEIH